MKYFRIESPIVGQTALAVAGPKIKPERLAAGKFQVPSGFDGETAGTFIHETLRSQATTIPESVVFVRLDGRNMATYWIEPKD